MHIEISDGDARVLHDILDAWLGEVSPEIRHTDNPGVRDELRGRRDSVRRVLELIEAREEAAG